jgi:hypothetical protein
VSIHRREVSRVPRCDTEKQRSQHGPSMNPSRHSTVEANNGSQGVVNGEERIISHVASCPRSTR